MLIILMSLQCQFCGTEFSARRNLASHQKTAKYCLAKQREQGVNVPEPEYVCSCGEKFRLRHHLSRHRERCDNTPSSVIQTQNNIGIGIQQNNININVFGTTMSSLTPELIAERVLEALSLEAVEKGVAHMTAEVARPAFTNEKGNWLVRVADGSRNKLIVRMDDGDRPDHQGHNTTRLLKKPFIEASLIALEKTDKPADVENTIEDIKDSEAYDRKTMSALLKIAPTKFDQTDPVIFTEAHRLAEEKAFAKLDRVMAKRKRTKAKQLELEGAKWKDDILDHSQDLHDGTFWHPIHRFVIQPDEEHEFSILGKREKRTDQTVPLTRADLKTIGDMGLGQHVSQEFAGRLA